MHSATHREHVESPPTDQKQVVGRVVAVLGDRMLAVVASSAPCCCAGLALTTRPTCCRKPAHIGSVGVDCRLQTAQCSLKGRRRGFGPAL